MRGSVSLGLLSSSLVLGVGCGDADPYEPVQGSHAELAHPGPWDIPAETLAIGDTQYVKYTDAGPWNNGNGCAGGMTPGNEILRQYLYDHFPSISSIGGYSCRQNTANLSQLSVHGTGRALDVMIPEVGSSSDADNDAGDPVGNWLIENAEVIGIQYIIWDRWTWSPSRTPGAKGRSYGGPNPHTDHLHVELSLASSTRTTDWFSGQVTPPSIQGCDPVPAEGRIIDERDACLATYGPNQYWRSEQGVGYDGSLLWTNAYDSDQPSNWARWHLDLDQGGSYRLGVFIDPSFGVHKETAYGITHAGAQSAVTIDQSTVDGWISLGEYTFDAGADQHVSVYDTTTTPPADNQHIAVDALSIVPASTGPGGAGGAAAAGSSSGGAASGGAASGGAASGGAGNPGGFPGVGGSAGAPDQPGPGGPATFVSTSDSGCSVSHSGRSPARTTAAWLLLATAGLWLRRRRAG